MIGDALTTANIGKGFQELILAHTLCLQHTCSLGSTFTQEGQKKMFLADILIPHTASLLKRLIKNLFQAGRGIYLAKPTAADFGKLRQDAPCFTAERSRIYSYFLQDRYDDSVHLTEKNLKKMLRNYLLIGVLFSQRLGLLNSLLGFHCKFVKLHLSLLNSFAFLVSTGKKSSKKLALFSESVQ